MSGLNSAGLYLITTVFDLYLIVLAVRLILAWMRANYFNPITRFIISITQPLIAPVRRVLPTYKGFEFATFFWMIIVELIKLSLLSVFFLGPVIFIMIFLIAVLSAIKMILSVFFYSILIGAIMSLLSPQHTPLSEILNLISAPILRPLRRIIPPIGGMDITPIPAMIILQVLIRLI